ELLHESLAVARAAGGPEIAAVPDVRADEVIRVAVQAKMRAFHRHELGRARARGRSLLRDVLGGLLRRHVLTAATQQCQTTQARKLQMLHSMVPPLFLFWLQPTA